MPANLSSARFQVQLPPLAFFLEAQRFESELRTLVEDLIRYTIGVQQSLDRLSDAITKAIEDRHMIGPLSERPAASERGRRFFATDENREYVDDGKTWLKVSSTPAGALRNAVVSFTGSERIKTVTLSPKEINADYRVIPSVFRKTAGALPVLVTIKDKLAGSFRVELSGSPGSGETIEVDWVLTR